LISKKELYMRFPITRSATMVASSLALAGLPFATGASSMPQSTGTISYEAHLASLNNSGASGTAHLTLNGTLMTVSIDAYGLLPGHTHDQHIHGSLDGTVATCPTMAQDTNHDGFVSVREGASKYGPIKVNLTSPQTPFGPSPDPALFAPYAGMDNMAGFPMANTDGSEHFTETYSFNLSDASAAAAYKGVMPLEAQHIVIHGAMAPENVDTLNTTSTKVVYDDLLPVACGEIVQVPMSPEPTTTPSPATNPVSTPTPAPSMSSQSASNVTGFEQAFNALTDQYNSLKATNMHDAHDAYVRNFFEARNKFVDQMNQIGDIATRDQVSSQYQSMLESNVR
jgi:hypothetical protein